MTDASSAPIPAGGLAELTAMVRRDLDLLNLTGGPTWTRTREGVLDAAIVGGGQCGLAAAFGLMREKISNILVVDENPPGLEGPWATYARMITLRSPKHLTPIDFGMPNLTCRAWWEAQHGPASWAALDKIPRGDWMAYLRWYRETLAIPVRNGARVTSISPCEAGVHRVGLASGETLLARKVILATGIQGGGEWHTPDFIKTALTPNRWAHTAQDIDYAALKGRRIAILGGGASAFDNAQHALNAGVAQAHVHIRRPALPQVNVIRYMETVRFSRSYAGLDDATKYAVSDSFLTRNQPPTNDTFRRAAAHAGFALHVGSPWLSVREVDDEVEVTTPNGAFRYDFLVLSTGMKTDAALRPELAALADDIALWRDRYVPPPGRCNPLVDDHPYLGPGFEFTGKTAEGSARLHGLFAFNYSALVSLGLSASALSGMGFSLPRLASAVAGQLFLDDQETILSGYFDFAEPEFTSQWSPPTAFAELQPDALVTYADGKARNLQLDIAETYRPGVMDALAGLQEHARAVRLALQGGGS